MSIRQITGLANAKRIAAVNSEDESTVVVRDELGMVVLSVRGCTYPAGLTPEQARFVAECLVKSADRVEQQS